jgi:hypothetical protein
MELAFLRAEIDAPRYRQFFANVDRRLIDEPNRTDPEQNRARREPSHIVTVSTTACPPTPAGSSGR